MDRAQALWHISPTQSLIKSVDLKHNAHTKFLLEAKYSLISTGTERLVARGSIPKDMYTEMKVPYMEGNFDMPIKYGYSLVAEVITPNHPLQSKIVQLLHPHQSICEVSDSDVTIVPEGIPPARATLVSNMETAVNAIWDAGISIGDKVVVVGFGIIGSLIARLLSMMPAIDLHILEKDQARISLGRKMGFPIGEDATENQFDAAFHTSGSSTGLQKCINLVGKEGKVVELSWYGTKQVVLKLGGNFHSQRKQIISSQVGQLPSNRLSRWDFKRRKHLVMKLLENSVFDTHLTSFIPFDESPKFFDALRKGPVEGLGHCIVY